MRPEKELQFPHKTADPSQGNQVGMATIQVQNQEPQFSQNVYINLIPATGNTCLNPEDNSTHSSSNLDRLTDHLPGRAAIFLT